MPTFRAAVFDLDGCLVHSLPSTTEAFNKVVAPHLGTPLSEQEVRGINGPLNERTLSQFVPADVAATCVSMLHHQIIQAAQSVEAYPGILELLEALRDKGIRLGLVTLRDQQSTETILHSTGMGSFFRSIVTADNGAKAFPDPAGLLQAIGQLESTPEDTLMISDRELDLRMARKAGFLTAAVTWGYTEIERLESAKPDVVFESLDALLH